MKWKNTPLFKNKMLMSDCDNRVNNGVRRPWCNKKGNNPAEKWCQLKI